MIAFHDCHKGHTALWTQTEFKGHKFLCHGHKVTNKVQLTQFTDKFRRSQIVTPVMGADTALMGEATPCLCNGAYDWFIVIQLIVFLNCHTWLVLSFSGRGMIPSVP